MDIVDILVLFLTVGLLQAFLHLKVGCSVFTCSFYCVPCSPTFSRAFIMKACWIFSKVISVSFESDHVIFVFQSMVVISFFNLQVFTIPAFQGKSYIYSQVYGLFEVSLHPVCNYFIMYFYYMFLRNMACHFLLLFNLYVVWVLEWYQLCTRNLGVLLLFLLFWIV